MDLVQNTIGAIYIYIYIARKKMKFPEKNKQTSRCVIPHFWFYSWV